MPPILAAPKGGIGLFEPVRIPHSTGLYTTIIKDTDKPFFHTQSANSTIKRFIEALAVNAEEAKCFVSKTCMHNIDWDALRKCFETGQYKCLSPTETVMSTETPRFCKTNAVLILNNDGHNILRLRMIREPDRFGQWKIFSIEKEA